MKREMRISGTRDLPSTMLVDPPKMRLEPEFRRLMLNWVQWKTAGGRTSSYMAYSAMASVLRGSQAQQAASGMSQVDHQVMIEADGVRVEAAVNALPGRERNVITVWWINGGSVRQKARDLGCRTGTLHALIEAAHALLTGQLQSAPKAGSHRGKPA